MQAQLKTAQATTQPKFLIELAKPTQDKIVFEKFPTLQEKNKSPDTQARQKSTRQMTQTDDIKMVVTHDRQERQPIKFRQDIGGLLFRMTMCCDNRRFTRTDNRNLSHPELTK